VWRTTANCDPKIEDLLGMALGGPGRGATILPELVMDGDFPDVMGTAVAPA